MKILHVNNCMPSATNPNMATYFRAMTECMLQAGHQVEELAISYNGRPGSLKKLWYYLAFWSKCLTRNLRRYDLVYVNHPPFCLPIFYNPTRSAAKTAVHWHGDDLASRNKPLRLLRSMLRRRIGRSRQFVPSQYFKRFLSEKMGYPEAIISVTPSGGVDTQVFTPRREAPRELTVGFPAELTEGKGADVLLFIAAHRDRLESKAGGPVSFSVIEYGSGASHFIEALHTTGADVKVWPKMPRAAMPDFYRSLSLVLMPSRRESESLGLVALEAMSCGVPVVAFDRCAFPEFIKPGVSGLTVPYSPELKVRAEAMLQAVEGMIPEIDRYTPAKIVQQSYSRQSVTDFYRDL